jgi:hypothetical protein
MMGRTTDRQSSNERHEGARDATVVQKLEALPDEQLVQTVSWDKRTAMTVTTMTNLC